MYNRLDCVSAIYSVSFCPLEIKCRLNDIIIKILVEYSYGFAVQCERSAVFQKIFYNEFFDDLSRILTSFRV